MYELALSEFLSSGDSAGFLRTVREDWTPDLFHVSAVVKPLVERLLLTPEEEDLQRALATLFSYQVEFFLSFIQMSYYFIFFQLQVAIVVIAPTTNSTYLHVTMVHRRKKRITLRIHMSMSAL